MHLRPVLDKLVEQLGKLGRPVDQLLERGIDSHAVVSALRNLQLDAPQELIELYEWRNGVGPGEYAFDLSLFPGFRMQQLSTGVCAYEAFRQALLQMPAPDFWQEGLFPVFNDGGAGYFLISCVRSKNYGAVFGMSPGSATELVFTSLSAMLHSIVTCYERGAYYVDMHGFLEEDWDHSAEIYRELNPTVPAWFNR